MLIQCIFNLFQPEPFHKKTEKINPDEFLLLLFIYLFIKTSFRDIYLTPLQNTTTWESIKILPASFTGAKWEFH